MAKFPIYHVLFPSQHLLAATFLRFQEHYESPKFVGKTFDLETFMDWYAADRGSFSYLTDWAGFNVPSTAFRPFFNNAFDPLTRKERWLVETFRNVPEPFYVIGTSLAGDRSDIVHEIVHGLYFADARYRHDVDACLAQFPLVRMRKTIREMGYAAHVLVDETNAYLLTGLCGALRGTDGKEIREARRSLRRIFIDRFGCDPKTRKGRARLLRNIRHDRFRPALLGRTT